MEHKSKLTKADVIFSKENVGTLERAGVTNKSIRKLSMTERFRQVALPMFFLP